jgi:hypothetical protein
VKPASLLFVAIAVAFSFFLVSFWSNSTKDAMPIPESGKSMANRDPGNESQVRQVLKAERAAVPARASDEHSLQYPLFFGFPLQDVYRLALATKVAEERSLAFRMASVCLGLPSIEGARASAAEIQQMSGRDSSRAERTLAASDAAIGALRSHCDRADSSGFMEELKKLPRPSLGSIMRSTNFYAAGDELRNQGNFQAVTALLANPALYPAQMDAWLDSEAFRDLVRRTAGSSADVSQVADEILGAFGMEAARDFRRLRLCGLQYICTGLDQISDADRMGASKIEQLIRTQRWEVIFARVGS